LNPIDPVQTLGPKIVPNALRDEAGLSWKVGCLSGCGPGPPGCGPGPPGRGPNNGDDAIIDFLIG